MAFPPAASRGRGAATTEAAALMGTGLVPIETRMARFRHEAFAAFHPANARRDFALFPTAYAGPDEPAIAGLT